MRITETGQMCLERFARVLGDIDDVAQLVQGGTVEPQGLLRISSTTLFWMHRIAPVLPEFQSRYPKIALQANLTERQVDLVEEGYDLALQITRPDAHSVVAKAIVPLRRVIYASPQYLERHGTPRKPEDLLKHNCLLYAYSGESVEWHFRKGAEEYRVEVTGSLRSSDANTLRLAALAGAGIARGPVFILVDDLNSGRLIHLLPQLESVDPDLWALYPSKRQLSAKVRAFIDFLEEKFADDPALRIPAT
jgi:DNA-binding transcriptional LysR family regulator